jgi:hypothetical protein
VSQIQNMLKYTKHNLSKLEEIFKDLKVTIRYEKGNFQSGYCIVTGKNIIIINKFFEVEPRINILMEILEENRIPTDELSEENREWLLKMKKSLLNTA